MQLFSRKSYDKADTYVADFETLSGDVDSTWVWAWASCNILDIDTCDYGNSIDSFFEWCKGLELNTNTIYFHNLSHDGSFILYYLFEYGAKYTDKFDSTNNIQFNTLIAPDGFYSINVKLKKRKIIHFRDSSKKIAGTVSKISEDWKTKYKKLELDYIEYHEPGEELSEDTIQYVCNDCRVIAEVIKTMYDMGMKGMTIASDSQKIYRSCYPFYYMDMPKLSTAEDEFVRRAYRGGWCYLNPIYEETVVDSGVIYDINSSYPSVMADKRNRYPVGQGEYFEGEPEKNPGYVYVCRIMVNMTIKSNKYPCIALKFAYNNRAVYLNDTDDDMIELTLTSVDLELMFDCYDIWDIEYIDGYRYKTKSGEHLFADFINPLYEGKNNSTGSKKQTYKVVMNSSYGKYGQKQEAKVMIPEFIDGEVTYKSEVVVNEENKGYIPVACFITAYARAKVVNAANANYDRFIYSDTDSIHLTGWMTPEGIEIDKTALGAWDDEYYFDKGKYCKQKTYFLLSDDKCKVTCAGMSESCKKVVKANKEYYFDKFHEGLTIPGANLKSKRIHGGVTLVSEDFTIKPGYDIIEM